MLTLYKKYKVSLMKKLSDDFTRVIVLNFIKLTLSKSNSYILE